jgi:hypothetical protein
MRVNCAEIGMLPRGVHGIKVTYSQMLIAGDGEVRNTCLQKQNLVR